MASPTRREKGCAMSRHRRFAALAGLSAFALALSAAPVMASGPAMHESRPLEGLNVVIYCDSTTYTIISGTVVVVMHASDDFATGHQTFSLRDVLVQRNDDQGVPGGPSYRVVGSETHGYQAGALDGRPAVTDTFKYRILGTGDSINLEVHSGGPDGYFVVNRGTCAPAEG